MSAKQIPYASLGRNNPAEWAARNRRQSIRSSNSQGPDPRGRRMVPHNSGYYTPSSPLRNAGPLVRAAAGFVLGPRPVRTITGTMSGSGANLGTQISMRRGPAVNRRTKPIKMRVRGPMRIRVKSVEKALRQLAKRDEPEVKHIRTDLKGNSSEYWGSVCSLVTESSVPLPLGGPTPLYIPYTMSSGTAGQSSTLVPGYTAVAQGGTGFSVTTGAQRVGLKIKPLGIRFRLEFMAQPHYVEASGVDPRLFVPRVRLIALCIKDNDILGTALETEAHLSNYMNTIDLSASQGTIAFIPRLQSTHEVQVLYDKTIILSRNIANSSGYISNAQTLEGCYSLVEDRISMRGRTIEFSDDTVRLAVKNQVYFYAFSDYAGGASPLVRIRGQFHAEYTDV